MTHNKIYIFILFITFRDLLFLVGFIGVFSSNIYQIVNNSQYLWAERSLYMYAFISIENADWKQ